MTPTVEITPPDTHGQTTISAINSDPDPGWKLLYNPAVPDLFSGAATFNYPIEAPPGRNGLQPAVNLVYSSRAIDGLLDTGAIDAGPIALGWSLNFMDVVREGTYASGDGGGHQWMNFPNQYSLLIDGTGHELQPDTPNANFGRYHAKDLPGYSIERRNDLGGGGAPNLSREYWLVHRPDGTVARLGYTSNSEQATYDGVSCAAYCGARTGSPYSSAASRWRVDAITDTFGNVMTYSYVERLVSKTSEVRFAYEQSRPAEIDYNAGSGGWGSQIKFRHTIDADPAGQVINLIQVYNTGALLREYRLDQNWEWNNACGQSVGTYVVNSIQAWDGTGATSLPATTFQYQPLAHTYAGCAQFSLLKRIANGYGAITEFDYLSDDRKAGNMGLSYRVSEQRVLDGLNSSPARTRYTYGTPCYNQSNGSSAVCTGFGRIETYGPLVGHDVVTRTVLDFDAVTPLAIDAHRYYINSGNSPLLGREYLAQTFAPGHQLLAQNNSTFTTTPINQTTFTYVSQSDSTTYDGGIAATQRITYTYDLYGNLKARFEYGDPAIGGDERRTTWDYYPNTNPNIWIVNQPAQESVYAGLSGPLVAQTRHIYDNLPGYTSAPTQGALTRVRRWDGNAWLTTTQTAYDAWGNPTVSTNALSYTTTTTYDDAYHLYPIVMRNSLNHTTRTDYHLAWGVPLSVTDANYAVTNYRYDALGRLLKVIKPGDSEGIPTIEYQYSDIYSANGLTGLRVTQNQREVSGDGTAYRTLRNFYDGTGRLVQTRAEANDGSQQAVTNIVYDARGLAQSIYVAAFESTNPDFIRPAGWNTRPRTQSQYDALGRTIVITNTDNTTTRTAFSGRSTGVLDANGHQHINTADALGRLIMAKEYATTQSAINFGLPTYATTTYAYNALDNLTRVTDALSNTTIITYNLLGQKTAMTDVDMGTWSYAYDPAGNLTRQTDARGQRICFYYDPLDRLTGKHYRSDDACPMINPALNVSYTYDSGVNGIGRRTGLTDATGSSSWLYDVRGRTIVASRTIAGVRTFGLGYTYDALDRVTQIIYPNGEVVKPTYNAASQVNSVSGANAYVSNLTYNAQGQMQQMNLGNTLVTQYAYDPLSFRLKRLQTGSLLDLNYDYDRVGNIRHITDTLNSTQVQTFGYDALDRLSTAKSNAAGNGQYSEDYVYNEIGNILNKGSAAYQYTDPLHKHAVITAGSNSYTYDLNGNMLTRNEGGTLYSQQWDEENRLSVVTNTLTHEVTKFTYDGDGTRALQVYSGTYTSTTIYLGAPTEITILGAPLPPPTATIPPTMTHRTYLPLIAGGAPLPPRTQPFANETWKMYYAVGNQLVAVRSLTSTGSVLNYLHSDHLGSTSLATDASGAAVPNSRQMYYPYGEPRVKGTSLPTNIGFTGQRLDATGLMFYGARYYSSGLGRFISADTMVPDGTNPQQFNRFSYGLNSPLNYVDPTGHYTCSGHEKCNDIIEQWLSILKDKGGDLGADLVAFFRQLDESNSFLCLSGCGDRITIQITSDKGISGRMIGDSGRNLIQIGADLFESAVKGITDNSVLAGVFAHEIQHIRQTNANNGSVHSEMEAWELQYQLYDKMGLIGQSQGIWVQGATDLHRELWGEGDDEIEANRFRKYSDQFKNLPLWKGTDASLIGRYWKLRYAQNLKVSFPWLHVPAFDYKFSP